MVFLQTYKNAVLEDVFFQNSVSYLRYALEKGGLRKSEEKV